MSEPKPNRAAAFSALAVAGLIVNLGVGLISGFFIGIAALDHSADSWPYYLVGAALPLFLNTPVAAALFFTRPGAAGAGGWLTGTALGLSSALAVIFLMVSICA